MISVKEHVLHNTIDMAANRFIHIVRSDNCCKSEGSYKVIIERIVAVGSEEAGRSCISVGFDEDVSLRDKSMILFGQYISFGKVRISVSLI